MFTQKTFEELCELKQSGQLTWLELVQQSEYSQEFAEWCYEVGLSETEDNAFLFLEKKESDSYSSASLETLKIAFL